MLNSFFSRQPTPEPRVEEPTNQQTGEETSTISHAGENITAPILPTGEMIHQPVETHEQAKAGQINEGATTISDENKEVAAPILPINRGGINPDTQTHETEQTPEIAQSNNATLSSAQTQVDAPILPTTRGINMQQETQQRTIDPAVLAFMQQNGRQG